MISKIREILNTDIVISEKYKNNIINLLNILIKILKSNIFIFFIFGTIVSIIFLNNINWNNNYYLEDSSKRIDFIYYTIVFMLFYYIPFFLSIILNLIIKFTKNERIKKVFKIIMIIINIISVLYLSFLALFICTFELPPQS